MDSYNAALGLDSRSVHAHLGLARLAMLAKQITAAERYVQAAVENDPDNARAHYLLGDVKRAGGNFDDALSSYDQAIALSPRFAAARIARAAVRIDTGQIVAARDDIALVQKYAPRHPQAAYLEALLLSREGKLQEASELLGQTAGNLASIERSALDNNASALLLAGAIANARGQPQQAQEYLEAFLDKRPNHVVARQILGSILIRQGEARYAVQVLHPAVAARPDDPIGQATIGIAYRMSGQAMDSVKAFESAVRAAPDKPGLRLELAVSRAAAGQHGQAVDELKTLAGRDGPQSTRASVTLARLLLELGDLPAAREAIHRAFQREPDNVAAHLVLGAAAAATGDLDTAVDSYSRALALDETNVEARLGLANMDLAQGKQNEAQRRFESVLDTDRENVLAMLGLARVARASGQVDVAVRWLEKASVTRRSVLEPQIELVRLLLSQDQTGRALEAAKRMESAAPEDARALQTLARVYLARNDRSAATRAYRRIGGSATARQLTAVSDLQLRIGDREGARISLDKALQREPGSLPALAGLVAVDIVEQRLDDATARTLQIRQAYPERSEGYWLQGDVHMAGHQFNAAVQAYEQALEREGSSALVAKLYHAKVQAGAQIEAIADLESWILRQPEDSAAGRLLAFAYLSVGRLAEALTLHEKVLDGAPDDPQLLNNLAWLYQSHGDERARAVAERAYALSPADVAVLDTYGWILLEHGEPEQALKVLRHVSGHFAAR